MSPEPAITNPAESADVAPLRLSHLLAAALPALAATALFTLLVRAVTGPNLGLFFGGVLGATLLAPGMIAAEANPWRRLAALCGAVDGVGLIWLFELLELPVGFSAALGAYIVLTFYVAALWALVTLLLRIRLAPALAAGAVVLIGLAWLTWPIWMAPQFNGRDSESLVAWLVAPHPLMTINGLMLQFDPWPTYSIAYRLTNIGDDVNYEMPRTIWAALALHGAIAVALGPAAEWLRRRR